MTPRTEKKVARVIKEMKQEREHLFIMATELLFFKLSDRLVQHSWR